MYIQLQVGGAGGPGAGGAARARVFLLLPDEGDTRARARARVSLLLPDEDTIEGVGRRRESYTHTHNQRVARGLLCVCII